MNWIYKAAVMKICGGVPFGDQFYKFLQKKMGNLNSDPMKRIHTHIEMMKYLVSQGESVSGKTIFEVGTGHKPIIPIGFFLCGADKIITADLHARLDFQILKGLLNQLIDRKKQLLNYYSPYVESNTFNERFRLIEKLKDDPRDFLNESTIEYKVPMDASRTKLPDASIDYHISCTVLEHIPQNILCKIFEEASRIVRHDGKLIHFVDMSDHFSHGDTNISAINFLKYSEKEWKFIAENEFAYCNRLRACDYIKIFESNNMELLGSDRIVQEECLELLEQDFVVDEGFKGYSTEELCSVSLRCVMKKRIYVTTHPV